MSGLRRSTRSIGRNPDYADQYASQANEVAQGLMGLGNTGMGYHVDPGFYPNPSAGFQHHHGAGFSNYPNYGYPYQQQHQYPTYSGYHNSGSGDASHSQSAADDSHGTSHTSGRTLRARTSGSNAASASASSSTAHASDSKNRRRRISGAASTSGVPPTSGGNMDDESGGDDDDDHNDGIVVEGSTSTKSKKGPESTALAVDQMVQNCLYYLFLMQHKKIPIKKSDLMKNALNSQHKQFAEVMKKVETVLKDVFGMRLVRLGKEDHARNIGKGLAGAMADLAEDPRTSDKKGKGKGGSSESYILISKFPSSVCDSVTRRDPEMDSKKTVLYLVLTTIFMQNKPIDEEVIWKVITKMELDQMVCKTKSALRKFLKSEFVSSGYLDMEQSNHPPLTLGKYSGNENKGSNNNKPPENEDVMAAKYSWGTRAHLEYSKYSMLKFAVKFTGRNMYEFTSQLSMLSKEEKALMEKEMREGRSDNDVDNIENAGTSGDSGSALQIRQKKGGKETFSIDGENTETEME